MRHSFISPTRRDALRLVNAIDAHGWHARVTDSRGHIAVIIHAPAHVVEAALRRARFTPEVGRASR